ncbi:MAG TPA: DUF2029 domain-containing protein [bacterium]|nr:DUF2029 domain-containing protein [bacterium]
MESNLLKKLSFQSSFFPKRYLKWGLWFILFLSLHFFLVLISSRFTYDQKTLGKPILLFAAIQIIAGLIYLLSLRDIYNHHFTRGFMYFAFAIGLALRLSMFASNPILEDDYYRYMWDGAVLMHGVNPYAYAPDEVLSSSEDMDTLPTSLRKLSNENKQVLERINHPHLRTIYPPVAQAFFAVAYMLAPWNLNAWRLVLLACDMVTVFLLFIILKSLNLPLMWFAIYWWNPLVIKEVFNSGHMDVLVLPFVLGAFVLSRKGRYSLAAVVLALAVGVKVWPVILLPIMLRPIIRNPRQLLSPVILFSSTVLLLFLPIYTAGIGHSSGFNAYSRLWEMNDTFFMLLLWMVRFCLRNSESAQLVTRAIVMIILTGWIAWTALRDTKDHTDILKKPLMVVAALFLLSPTQFPWYYIWIIPFLTIIPQTSLLLLTILLPLYYLRFYFNARGMVNIFDYGIVWIEFVPVWLLLIWEWYRSSRKGESLHGNSLK